MSPSDLPGAGSGSRLTTYRELERKVRVPEVLALPQLAGVAPGVVDVVAGDEITMVAAYHDTPDLRLIRWGATLRRREGGPDEGWHLKLPVASDGVLVRDELTLPLEAGETGRVPAEIEDVVRALVRAEPLVHVVTVRTRRTPYALLDDAGTEVAELVDDRVETVEGGVVVHRFRELEVEARREPSEHVMAVLDAVVTVLVAHGGTPTTRSKAAEAFGPRGGGAPDVVVPPWPGVDDPASETIRGVLATSVRALLLADVGVRRDLPDSVHQMRVAARTLRSALRTFAPLVDAEWSAGLRADLRRVADALATIRDTEVHLARLETDAALLPPEDRARAVEVVGGWLRERLEGSRAAALSELRSERHLRLLTGLVDAARDPHVTGAADEPAGVVLPPLVRAASRRLTAFVDRLEPDSPAAQWHRARILAKRARYAADAVAPILGTRARRWGEGLARVTDVLGDLHDASVAQQMMRELASRRQIDGLTGYALGLLDGIEADRAEGDKETFDRLWPQVRRTLSRRLVH
ncbi:CYTH and CHAD domain-containing protein [Cellulomonas sp. KRMCY2]|uniref:CYTH and CHAD domain-containing protein n=1 Tax=Cellulomonas sp. KRMCY2 TaxID=1304865 RepID=UPI00045E9260|nr:CYTH and CHAD domain-containing protein [Cellulomonas sp. KRMCY2]